MTNMPERFPTQTTIIGLLAVVGMFVSPVLTWAQTSEESTGAAASDSSAPSGAAAARTDGEVSNVVQELSQTIYSPFCPGKTLAMCPSSGAAEVRRDIQDMARKGRSREEIKEAVIDTYGEEFRFENPPATDNIPLFVILSVGFVICSGAVWYLARRRTDDNDDEDGSDGSDLSEEDEMYLDEIRSDYME